MSRGHNPTSTDSPFASAQALDMRVCSEVGARLGTSRSQRGWTSSDVANRLLLSTAQVSGLERADASAFHNPAFFAAALRKYATLMALDCPDAFLTPKSPTHADLAGPRRTREDPRRAVSAAETGGVKTARSSVPMEWLAVAAIVVLTGVGAALYFGGKTSAPVAVAPPRVDRPDAALPETLSTSAPSTPAPVATDPPAPLAATPVGDAAAGTVTLTRPAWVFVRYGDNSVVERTLQAGQSLTLTSAPIYLAIGAGDGVTLRIGDRAVDVSPFRNGDEIRIRASDLAALAR